MKHTPGPWMAAAKPSSVVGLPVVATPSGRSIASVTFFALGDDFANHDKESQANARLIAAAPEMLKTLEGIANNAEKMAGDPMQANRGLWAACAEDARAAIKNATVID